ncbi:MAG: hypothetical protein CK532_07725 [Flavobacteriales bacterium]|nr:MAG: hypothetical protein CK532_07725 [Flavobacteriales bacterium]
MQNYTLFSFFCENYTHFVGVWFYKCSLKWSEYLNTNCLLFSAIFLFRDLQFVIMRFIQIKIIYFSLQIYSEQ